MTELVEDFGYSYYCNNFGGQWIVIFDPFYRYHSFVSDSYGDTVI